MQLQKQCYPTLSVSKIIAKSLIVNFEKKSNDSNIKRDEKLLAKVLYNNLQKYLIDKVTEDQKRITLVIFRFY